MIKSSLRNSSTTSINIEWPSGEGRGTHRPCLKLRAEGREFDPGAGKYSRMSFSSEQVTGTVFSHLKIPFLPNSEFI